MGKCIETIPSRHQETLPIWPWLLQCIQCCQESKSVITATQCMEHSRSFAFYFLYSQAKPCPAAGRFLQNPQSPSRAPCTRRGTHSLRGLAPRCPALAPVSSPSAHQSSHPSHSLPPPCESYGGSTARAPHADCVPKYPEPCEKTACYFT